MRASALHWSAGEHLSNDERRRADYVTNTSSSSRPTRINNLHHQSPRHPVTTAGRRHPVPPAQPGVRATGRRISQSRGGAPPEQSRTVLLSLSHASNFTHHPSGPGRAIGSVCARAFSDDIVWMMIFGILVHLMSWQIKFKGRCHTGRSKMAVSKTKMLIKWPVWPQVGGAFEFYKAHTAAGSRSFWAYLFLV